MQTRRYCTYVAYLPIKCSRIVHHYNETEIEHKNYTTPKDKEYLRIEYLRNPTLTAPHFKNQLLIRRQVNVSVEIVIRRLKEIGLNLKHP